MTNTCTKHTSIYHMLGWFQPAMNTLSYQLVKSRMAPLEYSPDLIWAQAAL